MVRSSCLASSDLRAPMWECEDAPWWTVQASVFPRPWALLISQPRFLYLRCSPGLWCCYPLTSHRPPRYCCFSPEPLSSVPRAVWWLFSEPLLSKPRTLFKECSPLGFTEPLHAGLGGFLVSYNPASHSPFPISPVLFYWWHGGEGSLPQLAY